MIVYRIPWDYGRGRYLFIWGWKTQEIFTEEKVIKLNLRSLSGKGVRERHHSWRTREGSVTQQCWHIQAVAPSGVWWGVSRVKQERNSGQLIRGLVIMARDLESTQREMKFHWRGRYRKKWSLFVIELLLWRPCEIGWKRRLNTRDRLRS